MKTGIKLSLYVIISASLFNCSNPIGNNSSKYLLTINIPEVSSSGWKAAYVAWIEDLDGNNLQNLYICEKILKDITSNPDQLLGEPLPYWRRIKSYVIDPSLVDAITGASIQKSHSIIRTFYINDKNLKIKVCLEIDRSKNGNKYFEDRPSFIYKTDTIDFNTLESKYSLKLRAFMADNIATKGFAQNPPIKPIPDFSPYKYDTAIQYIFPADMFINETPESSHLTVEITQ